jgi:hypothetical protein
MPIPKLDIDRQIYVPEMWALIWTGYTFLNTTGITFLSFLKAFVVIFYTSLTLMFVFCRHKYMF